MRIHFFYFPILLFLVGCTSSSDVITQQDYQRAVSFTWSEVNDKQAFNLDMRVNWEEDYLWYKTSAPKEKQFLKYTYDDGQKSPLFDHEQIANILSEKLGKEVSPKDLPIERLTLNEDGNLLIESGEVELLLDFNSLDVLTLPQPETNDPLSALSPDGLWKAYSRDHNLYIQNVKSGQERQLTNDGKKDYEYATWYGWADIIEGETRDRPQRFSARWTEDSRYLICNLVDLREAQKMYLLDWSVDSLYRPRLLGYYRGSPGDQDMVTEQPVIFNIKTGKVIKPNIGRRVHINGVSVQETHDPDKLLLSFQSRGYQNQYLKLLDLKTGKMTDLYEESSQTNIDNFRIWPTEGTSKWIFASEKSGWRQLYVLDIVRGEYQALTNGDYYVNDVVEIDEDSNVIYFLASGKEEGANPYLQMLYRLDMEDSDPLLLTPEILHHRVDINLEQSVFVDNASTLDQPTVTLLRSLSDGTVLDTLGKADVSLLANRGWEPPMTFSTKARDNKTTIYGSIWKPSHFDPNKKYPIIDHSYTGPHTQVFPKSFSNVMGGNQALAELGFIVVMIDGLGSSGRSKAFHDWSYKNLGGNLADHKVWIEALADKYSWADAKNVGIFGHSAGGYDAGHGLLAFPDFYDVGVASSADHDHRMEKAWWPEMYMGWPVDTAYHNQSNITMAGNLKGKLLITHGGIDENVNPSATFKLAEALVKADKQFDMKIFPSQRHGYRGEVRDYFTKLRWNYFVEHLRGVEPIWEIELHPSAKD